MGFEIARNSVSFSFLIDKASTTNIFFRFIFNDEVKSHKLRKPWLLCNFSDTFEPQVLQDLMIGSDGKLLPRKGRPSFLNCEKESQNPLISGQDNVRVFPVKHGCRKLWAFSASTQQMNKN